MDEATPGAKLDRRAMIKRSAVVGAVAWTAPMIIDSLSSPAAAGSCSAGSYYVAYQTTLAELYPNVTASSCTAPTTGTNVHPAAIGLTAAFSGNCGGSTGSIAHIVSLNGNCQPVTLTVGAGCGNCTITSVQAHVHNRGAGVCPPTYCQSASTTVGANLLVTAGALNTQTVTVAPDYTNTALCGTGIHWGSPSAPNGYLLVQITCT